MKKSFDTADMLQTHNDGYRVGYDAAMRDAYYWICSRCRYDWQLQGRDKHLATEQPSEGNDGK